MAELFEHQLEALAVARHRNVLLCSAQRVGKTFVVAMRVREWLQRVDEEAAAAPAISPATSQQQQQQLQLQSLVVAIAPTHDIQATLHLEVARLCSEPVWSEPTTATSYHVALPPADPTDDLALRLRQTRPVRVVIVSPRTFQAALRKRVLSMQDIGLLVLEGADQIHDTAPSLYRLAFETTDSHGHLQTRIVATTTTPASQLSWDPMQNPLFRRIQVLNLLPVVSADAMRILHGHAAPRLPLLLSDPFDADATNSSAPGTMLQCGVRDFLLGENDKKLDFVRVFRLELEMGNSAAVYDDKKKQERVNRFIQDAESVYQHLGLWCLLKYVELELQFNLHACLVEDVDNINHRRRQHQLEQNQKNGVIMNVIPTTTTREQVEEEDTEDDAEDEEGEVKDATRADDKADTLVAYVDAKLHDLDLDEARLANVKHILKVLAWLSSTAIALGAQAASPRLLKVAAVTRSRLSLSSAGREEETTPVRCWVFVERRAHCSVAAEYLAFALRDLGIPPCCSMLGHTNARIVGSLHFSSFLKVITKFRNGETSVLVTTSIARKSQKLRVETPPCDLVVVMDELLEADKLLDYCHRARAATGSGGSGGVVKYILPRGRADDKKFQLLVRKLKESAQLEAAATTNGGAAHDFDAFADGRFVSAAHSGSGVVAGGGGSRARAVPTKFHAVEHNAVEVTTQQLMTPPPTRAHCLPPPVPATRTAAASRATSNATSTTTTTTPANATTYEVVNADTGAVLNLENSVDLLSKFCETLPGLDTYDRRPQYYVKRHQITGLGMSASLKQAKKKKLKYNCKLDDKIDDLKAAAAQLNGDGDVEMLDENETDDARSLLSQSQNESGSGTGRFQFTAKLRLPVMIGAKKEIGSPKVWSDTEAKAIVAFKGCLELVKRGLVDRHFQSKLEPSESSRPPANDPHAHQVDTTVYVDDASGRGDHEPQQQQQQQQLMDLSTQNSYDLPPVSAAEMGLPTVRSLLSAATSAATGSPETSDSAATTTSISMCFYGIEGVRFAILSSRELYTGNTNTGWRYDFATSAVMEPVVKRVTLQKHATKLQLSKSELEEALHFHLVTMRLACMHVDDALREIDIAGDKVWHEFSEPNDKGYLVVPSRILEEENANSQIVLDWEYLREIISKSLLVDCWPLPPATEWPVDEWICVPTHRRNVRYVVRALTNETAGDAIQPLARDDATWKAHFKIKPVAGVPIFGRWHKQDQVKQADPLQPLIHGVQIPEIVPLIRRVMQRNKHEASVAQTKTKLQERYFLPQYTSLLRLTKTRYFEAMGIVPLLYEFERKCQMSHLMTHIGLELDLTLLDDATTKPAYERLEILGDCFLKLETSWFLFENRPDITEEGQLTQLRRDIIRNDRLNLFALAKRLHHYMLHPTEIEQHPFKFWKPSCMGRTPESVVAPSKWVADVLEAICGAYLVGHGESAARHFLGWVGVTVPSTPHVLATSYYPDCFPNELVFSASDAATRAQQRQLGFRVEGADDRIPDRLVAMQQRLQYTFRNKLLLLEAITHPSVGAVRLTRDKTETGDQQPTTTVMWRGNYERLEYLGDAVIEYLTLSYAFTRYASWLPGSLSQWKSATVSNDALGKTAIACFGIDECLLSGALKVDRESLEMVAKIERRYVQDQSSRALHSLHDRAATSTGSSKHPKPRRHAAAAATAINAMALPKMFADVFEALVAAVFLDSDHNLQIVRDVFLGPLLEVVGVDALAYVCRESGLSMDQQQGGGGGGGGGESGGRAGGGDGDFDADELRMFSDDDDDEDD